MSAGVDCAPGRRLLAGGSARPRPPPPNEQYFPLQSYRVGPYAAGGSGFFGGFIDYMQLSTCATAASTA